MCKDNSSKKHNGTTQLVRPVKLVNKLNDLVHNKRPISYLANTKLNGHLSSSSDCLSGDEGYFGSYSDTKINLNQLAQSTTEITKQQSIQSSAISQQEQVILLNYLLQNQQQQATNSLFTNDVVASDNNNNDIDALAQVPDDKENTTDGSESSLNIPCLNMFGSAMVSIGAVYKAITSIFDFTVNNLYRKKKRKFSRQVYLQTIASITIRARTKLVNSMSLTF